MNTERHIPAVLNSDTDERYFTLSDALGIENCRIALSLDGKDLRIENIKSTALVPGAPESVTNTCIGSCFDSGRRRILYACYGSTGQHRIYCYDITSGNFYTVLHQGQFVQPNGLNFSLDHRLDRNMRVIGDLLVWTDGNQDIRCINIDAGINSHSPGTYPDVDPYPNSAMDYFESTLIKLPPIKRIKVEKAKDGDFENNFIELNSFQFTWFYTYKDGSQSALAAYSDLVNFNNNVAAVVDDFNYVKVSIPSSASGERYPDDMQSINLCVKFGNNGKTFLVRTWDKRNQMDANIINDASIGYGDIVFNFYNNTIGAALDDVQSVNNFDNVPLTAKTLEVAKNRVFLGNVLNGYSAPHNTSLQGVAGTDGGGGTINEFWHELQFWTGTYDVNHDFHYDGQFYHSFFVVIGGLFYDFGNNGAPAAVNLSDAIGLYNNFDELVNSYWSAGSDGYYDTDPLVITDNTTTAAVVVTAAFAGTNFQFKYGSYYRLGITFFDRLRRKCGIATSDAAIVNIPQRDPGNVVAAPNVINWSLSNTNRLLEIPEFAEYYQISITKNQNFQFFIDTNLIQEVYYVTRADDGTYDFTGTAFDASKTYGLCFDLSLLISNGMGYTFTEGDLVTVFDQTVAPATGKTYYLRILGQSGKWLIATPVDVGTLPVSGSHFFSLEIYTPYVPTLNEPFYEVSDIYNINLPHGPFRSYSDTAGKIMGDVYYINYSVSIPAQAMSPNSNKWKDWERNLGWINLRDDIGQQDLKSTIVFSDTFIQGSQVNGINKFQALNAQSLTSETGAIQKLILTNKIAQEQGTVMLCICENEPLSIYLGETQLVSQEGNAYVAQSIGVIGTINALKGNFGTMHPESVIDYLGDVYWFDIMHGSWIMYSANGANPINYKLNKYFKLLGLRYQEQKLSARIISCIDPVRGQLMVGMPSTEGVDYPYTLPSYGGVVPVYATTIKSKFDLYDGQAKILVLSVPDNAWRYSIGFVPEWLEFAENKVYGFVSGAMHQMESGADFNSFFGQQLPARVVLPMSQTENAVQVKNAIKELFSLSIEGNMVPDYTLAYAKYPNEQITDLASNDVAINGKPAWQDINGIKYAGFLKDRLSPNVSGSAEVKMYAGDYLRSVTPFIMVEFKAYNELLIINALNLNYGVVSGHTS